MYTITHQFTPKKAVSHEIHYESFHTMLLSQNSSSKKPNAMDQSKEKDVPLTVRLPEDLKIALQRHANANGRRINAEICMRLRESLKTSFTPGASYAPTLAVLPSRYGLTAPADAPAKEEGATYTVFDDLDRAMLEVFRAMPVQKKLALLSLLQ